MERSSALYRRIDRASTVTNLSSAGHVGARGTRSRARTRTLSSRAGTCIQKPLRIGLFGGTFDPPHVGHLVTAVNVRHALALDRRDPDGRQRALAEGGHVGRSRRPTTAWRWCEAAVADVPGSRPATTRSTSAAQLHRRHAGTRWPCEHPGAELFTIVGDDAAAASAPGSASTRCWRSSRLVVVDRPGNQVDARRVDRLDPRRGAAPRGVEHRSAGPVRRRAPARLPRHRTGARRDPRPRPVRRGGAGVTRQPASGARAARWIALSCIVGGVDRGRPAQRGRRAHAGRLARPGARRTAWSTSWPTQRLPYTPTALVGTLDDDGAAHVGGGAGDRARRHGRQHRRAGGERRRQLGQRGRAAAAQRRARGPGPRGVRR